MLNVASELEEFFSVGLNIWAILVHLLVADNVAKMRDEMCRGGRPCDHIGDQNMKFDCLS